MATTLMDSAGDVTGIRLGPCSEAPASVSPTQRRKIRRFRAAFRRGCAAISAPPPPGLDAHLNPFSVRGQTVPRNGLALEHAAEEMKMMKANQQVLAPEHKQRGDRHGGGTLQHSCEAEGAGTSSIGILDVVESDFATYLPKEEKTETTAQETFETMTQENKITNAEKNQDTKCKPEDVASTVNDGTPEKPSGNGSYGDVVTPRWGSVLGEGVLFQ